MRTVRAKKRWGQNFLRDDATAAQIIGAMQVKPEDCVVEIGPGTGALTRHLLRTGAHICCVEIDAELHTLLKEEFAGRREKLRLVNRDILQLGLPDLFPQRVRVVTNAPYNISSGLLNYFCAQAPAIRDVHVMLQREVGDMLMSRPGSKSYKHMTVLMSLQFEIKRLMEVSRRDFRPEPKVDSVVLRLVPLRRIDPRTACELSRLLGAAFAGRRKKLRNALSAVLAAARHGSDLDLDRRADEVAPEEYLSLLHALSRRNKAGDREGHA